MQGGDLENLTTLLFSPPGVVSDLAVVINRTADDDPGQPRRRDLGSAGRRGPGATAGQRP